MTNNLVLEIIENMGSAKRTNRKKAAALFIKNPAMIGDLMFLTFKIDYKNHHKAAWILEIVLENNINYILPYLNLYTKKLQNLNHNSAIRPLAKINKWIAIQYVKKKNDDFLKQMKPKNIKELIEVGFDWLIGDIAVASKAYAMTTLYLLGQISIKNNSWVHDELKNVIMQNIQKESPAYKAQGKKILNRIT
jgi:hypothetical protein